MVTLIFISGLCRYVWGNILTLSPITPEVCISQQTKEMRMKVLFRVVKFMEYYFAFIACWNIVALQTPPNTYLSIFKILHGEVFCIWRLFWCFWSGAFHSTNSHFCMSFSLWTPHADKLNTFLSLVPSHGHTLGHSVRQAILKYVTTIANLNS